MPARKPVPPPKGSAALAQRQGDPTVSRALSELTATVNALPQNSRVVVVADLPVGATKLAHGLGRIPVGAHVTPTTADATWAWALTSKDRQFVEVTTIGVAQTDATVEIF